QGRIADIALVLIVVDMAIPHASGAAPLLFGVLVYGLASDRGFANAWFSTSFSVLLGRISFPLYLVHVMFILWLAYGLEYYHVPEWGRLLGLPLLLAFCFGSAWLLHIGVERPAHGFARTLFERRRTASPPLAAPSEAQAQS
ncbi:MAG: acyltransferase family protein, partial [Devosia sp.]